MPCDAVSLTPVVGVAACPRLRRLRLHHFEELVPGGLLGVRIAEASEYQHGVPGSRHGDAIRGAVGAGYIDFTAFTFQFPLLSRRFP